MDASAKAVSGLGTNALHGGRALDLQSRERAIGKSPLWKRLGGNAAAISDSRASRLLQYVVLPIGILLVWEALFRFGVFSHVALPSPLKVGATLWKLAITGQLFIHVAASILRVMEGFMVGAVLGLFLGVGIGISKPFARITDFVIQVLRPIPPIAWIPLAILWFGIGEISKVFIIFLGAFFPIVIGAVEGIRQTDFRHVELAKVLEVSRWKFIRRVVLPGALPSIITGLRVGLGTAWVCVVAAEMIAAESGVGYVIVDGRELTRPDMVIAGMITIGVIGKLMDVMLKRLENLLIRWKNQYAGE